MFSIFTPDPWGNKWSNLAKVHLNHQVDYCKCGDCNIYIFSISKLKDFCWDPGVKSNSSTKISWNVTSVYSPSPFFLKGWQEAVSQKRFDHPMAQDFMEYVLLIFFPMPFCRWRRMLKPMHGQVVLRFLGWWMPCVVLDFQHNFSRRWS